MTTKVVMNTKIKEMANAQNMSVSKNFYEVYNDMCRKALQKAIVRAQANDRKTIMSKDL